MSELIRVLAGLNEGDRDQAILRIMNEVLLPEWEAALAAHGDATSSSRIRAVQRVQNALAVTSRTFAERRRPADQGRLVEHERTLVARLLERCVACCRGSAAGLPASSLASCCVTIPPMRRAG